MKKKIVLTSIFTFIFSLTLSGCSFLSRLFNPETIFEKGYVDPDDPDYKPWVNDKEPVAVSVTYKDYIDNNYFQKSATPVSGNPKLVVIPVWFNDSNNFIEVSKRDALKNDISTAFFGTTEETGWNSVSSYYLNESQNALKFEGCVSNWYEIDKSYVEYARDTGSTHTLTTNLVKSATEWYFLNNPNESRKSYDFDNDGYLDGVILIYAAPNVHSLKLKNPELDESQYENLWAYVFWTRNIPSSAAPSVNAFLWASYDFMYPISSPKIGEYGYGGNGFNIDTHTYIHEMGHMFGLEDYYDYGRDKFSPAGGYSMQDENVGAHDPYSLYSLGWAKAYFPGNKTTIELKPFQESHEVIILTPEFNQYNSPFDEYLMLEFYTPTSLNEKDSDTQYMGTVTQGPKQAGIRLWHVDSRLLYGNSEASFITSENVTTNPRYRMPSTNKNGVLLMNSNTYDRSSDHATRVQEEGANLYNILQLIHADNRDNAIATKINNHSIFTLNQTFTMHDYSSQFVKGERLNSGAILGFSFTISELTATHVRVDIDVMN